MGSDPSLDALTSRGWSWLRLPFAFCAFLIWSHSEIAADSRGALNKAKLVAVLYANETSTAALLSGHYQELIRILSLSQGELAIALRAQLAADAVDFPASVARNATALMAHAQRIPFDLALFTNEMTLNHRFALYRGAQASQEFHLIVPPLDLASIHPFLSTAPLSDSKMLQAALSEVVRQYPKQPIDIVLLIFSHGTLEMALMPRANVDLRVTTEDEIRAALEREASAPTPAWARLQGTSKPTFWRVLGDVSAANPQIRFPLVVMAACQSVIMSWEEYLAIPDSVGLVGHTGLQSPTLKSTHLEEVFALAHNSITASDLAEGARRAGFNVDSRVSFLPWLIPITLWQIPLVLYLIPLPVWLIGYAVVRWYRKRFDQSRAGAAGAA